jgi:hypothetical protein
MLQRFIPRIAPALRKTASLPRPQRTLLRAGSSFHKSTLRFLSSGAAAPQNGLKQAAIGDWMRLA